jgi:hypothetical protein
MQILFFLFFAGNSLALHPAAEAIDWYQNNGMAASKPENDYAHLVFNMTDSIMPDKNIRMRILNIAGFERHFAGQIFTVINAFPLISI